MKYNQSRPGFEPVSPCPFPTMITNTPRAPCFRLYSSILSPTLHLNGEVAFASLHLIKACRYKLVSITLIKYSVYCIIYLYRICTIYQVILFADIYTTDRPSLFYQLYFLFRYSCRSDWITIFVLVRSLLSSSPLFKVLSRWNEESQPNKSSFISWWLFRFLSLIWQYEDFVI